MAAQIIHASGESVKDRVLPGTYAVALQAPKERLKALAERLSADGIDHCQIVENAGDFAGELTAIGATPKKKSEVQRYFSSLPLIR